jgi:hypothetical protein
MLSSGFSTFDQNEKLEYTVDCNYSITRTWIGANMEPQQETHYFFGTADNELQCSGRQRHHIAGLNMGVRKW